MGQLTPHQVLIQRFVELHPEEAARQLDDAGADEAVSVLQREDAASAAKVLQRMELHSGARILARLDDAALDSLLNQLDPAFIARLFAHLDESERTRILALAGSERGRKIQEILSYPLGTAGSLMDAQVSTFAVDCTVAAALERVRQLGNRRATDLVLRDASDRYAGVVRLPDVVAADPELLLGELRDGAALQVQAHDAEGRGRRAPQYLPPHQPASGRFRRTSHRRHSPRRPCECSAAKSSGRGPRNGWCIRRRACPVQAVGGHSQPAALAQHQPRNCLSRGCGRRYLRGHDCQVYRARGPAARSRRSVGQHRRAGPRRDHAGTHAARNPHFARSPCPRQRASNRLLQRTGHCRCDRNRRLRLEPKPRAGPRHAVRHVGVP